MADPARERECIHSIYTNLKRKRAQIQFVNEFDEPVINLTDAQRRASEKKHGALKQMFIAPL